MSNPVIMNQWQEGGGIGLGNQEWVGQVNVRRFFTICGFRVN